MIITNAVLIFLLINIRSVLPETTRLNDSAYASCISLDQQPDTKVLYK